MYDINLYEFLLTNRYLIKIMEGIYIKQTFRANVNILSHIIILYKHSHSL